MGIVAVGIVVMLDAVSMTSGPTFPSSQRMQAVALASPRPHECETAGSALGAPGQRARSNVWETAREPKFAPYCDRLARGYAELPLSPDRAYEHAVAAGDLLPKQAAPWILRARASSRLGLSDRAASEFERARALEAHALDEPAALRDWAGVLTRAGRTTEALAAYRALGPRLSLVYTVQQQASIWLEAAALASSSGPAGIDDAIAFLEEARRVPPGTIRLRVLADLALALDRRGDHDRAESVGALVARRSDGVPALEGSEDGTTDFDAAIALLSESRAPRAASELWNRYLRGPAANGPWAAHAARHRDALQIKPVRGVQK